jgi:hydroxymethylglutaryl-CoA lyase
LLRLRGGNLATEDLVYFLDASGWETGVSLDGVLAAARYITTALGRPLATKVGQAGGWDPKTGAPLGRA